MLVVVGWVLWVGDGVVVVDDEGDDGVFLFIGCVLFSLLVYCLYDLNICFMFILMFMFIFTFLIVMFAIVDGFTVPLFV